MLVQFVCNLNTQYPDTHTTALPQLHGALKFESKRTSERHCGNKTRERALYLNVSYFHVENTFSPVRQALALRLAQLHGIYAWLLFRFVLGRLEHVGQDFVFE